MTRSPRARARAAYADALVKRNPKLANAASNIVHGHFENIWITPALDALEVALRGLPDEEEGDDSEEGQRA